eukprot:TRINITY_DN2791_c0_g1_i3.p1 TRINITY_DN2791_c0_g1~~TRINITY_DN2791_c0_g1_i3.p1  ORF type:complete len:107 (-),score=4.85 TRINITY_DN2791_c0_g1_i3:83-403(-)
MMALRSSFFALTNADLFSCSRTRENVALMTATNKLMTRKLIKITINTNQINEISYSASITSYYKSVLLAHATPSFSPSLPFLPYPKKSHHNPVSHICQSHQITIVI